MSARHPYIIDREGNDVDLETLTEFGRLWAEANKEQSVVAAVALSGYSGRYRPIPGDVLRVGAWPIAHVQTAIIACNAAGAREAGLPVT